MKEVNDILQKLTLEEKAALLSQIVWETTDVSKYGINGFLLADGPAGLRRLKDYFDEDIYNTVPTTCYPSPSTYASSWDTALLYDIGRHLGIEAHTEDVDVLLGPGVNIKRSPLGGRNFEYYSEDPFLTGELATAYINGLQQEGIGACMKHFAVNNQETNRMTIDAKVDERALHEIYLKAFEKPVIEGKPWMVMTAYNRVNGAYCANNETILKETLRKKWGYDGCVVTDCYAAHNLAKGIKNGLNLQMPGETAKRLAQRIQKLIHQGEITELDLEKAISSNIELSIKCRENTKSISYDREEHHNFSRQAALESMVLLKNENAMLPLKRDEKIALIGEMAEKSRFQGGGSSHVNPYRLENIRDSMAEYGASFSYSKGYEGDHTTEYLIDEALQCAKNADKVLLCIGLPEIYESEGYDREHLSIPAVQQQLMDQLHKVNSNLIIVLFNGAPVEMPWISKAEALLEAYLPGEALGSAVVQLLYGESNPCGKLAETFPLRLEDTPSYLNFPGNTNQVEYREGIYVGYRYYDKKNIPVQYPFGYGLSYTSFQYSSLSIARNMINENETCKITFWIENIGKLKGKEIVQLYVRPNDALSHRPEKELKAFTKTELQPGEKKQITFELKKDAFAYYDEELHQWVVEDGTFEICIGSSSRDIHLKGELHVMTFLKPHRPVTENTSLKEMLKLPERRNYLKENLKRYPRSMEFVLFCESKDPLVQSMGNLMSFQTLKRVDDKLTDEVIEEIVDGMNNLFNISPV